MDPMKTWNSVFTPAPASSTECNGQANSSDDVDLASLGAKSLLIRDGHTEERDELIEFLRNDLCKWHTVEQAVQKLEDMIDEHRRYPRKNKLKNQVPILQAFHTRLPLRQAFHTYDKTYRLSQRKHVRPSFADFRHILNIAQLNECACDLQMVTVDGDGTIYTHNQNISNKEIILSIIDLLNYGLYFGLVTAAGYPGAPERYEQRLEALLDAMHAEWLRQGGKAAGEPFWNRFFVLGGECNYFARCVLSEDGTRLRLKFVDERDWKTEEMQSWQEGEIARVLDRAEEALKEATARLDLPVKFIRKERAVGIIPEAATTVEVLEEVVLGVHHDLEDESLIPFTAFNSRCDVFLDIGSKGHGIAAMRRLFGVQSAAQAIHIGDELYETGNDRTARSSCCTLWVSNEDETPLYLRLLHQKLTLPLRRTSLDIRQES